MKFATAIDSSWTINEVLGLYPGTVTVLNAYGVDMCCGGDQTIEVASGEAHVDQAALVAGLLDAAAESKAAR